MKLLIACGTWIKDNDRKVIRYIQSCEIFPNVSMICTATGLSERSVLHTLGMLRQQEGFCVSRIRLFWIDDTPLEELRPTHNELLIFRLLLRYKDSFDIHDMMENNRFYDKEGNIQYRFTEEEIRNALHLKKMMGRATTQD